MSTDVCGEHPTYATRTGKLDSKKGHDAPFISDYRLQIEETINPSHLTERNQIVDSEEHCTDNGKLHQSNRN
ncbi:hypothetical protein VHTUMSATKI_44690 [Vibrio harveyi]|nr:hypothetical protein VH1807_contig00007-0019 [Vibrio harveyi]